MVFEPNDPNIIMPFSRRFTDWKPWFAWRPVKVNGNWMWMKKIYRKRSWITFLPRAPITNYYGTIFDVLREENHNEN